MKFKIDIGAIIPKKSFVLPVWVWILAATIPVIGIIVIVLWLKIHRKKEKKLSV